MSDKTQNGVTPENKEIPGETYPERTYPERISAEQEIESGEGLLEEELLEGFSEKKRGKGKRAPKKQEGRRAARASRRRVSWRRRQGASRTGRSGRDDSEKETLDDTEGSVRGISEKGPRSAGKRPRRRKPRKADSEQARRVTRRLCILLGAVFVAAGGAGVFLFLHFNQTQEELPEIKLPEVVVTKPPERQEDLGSDVLDHIITAGNAVWDSFRKRPATHELTQGSEEDFADVTECIIDPETRRISVKAKGDGIPKSDDKFYYLFALNTYEESIPEDGEYLARDYKDNEVGMTTTLNYNHAGTRLFKKFVVAVKKDGTYVPVTTPRYITNPEAIARYSSVFQQPASIKGLLVDPARLSGSELDDLGVKQAAYNIPVARLLGPTTNPAYPSIQYTYDGRTYTFNGQVVKEYDIIFGTLTAKGITTTAIILNNYSSAYQQLIHPKARGGGSAPYYMFNGAEESGVEYMAAIATFLAERYSDNTHGRISNWVIANEINARKEWNHMAHVDLETYVEEYARGFRVFYNAIKSVSSSARVYISIDQQWDRNIKNNTNYDGRDILDVFNRNISSKGNIDWGVAQHPYNVPLTESRVWKPSKYVEHNAGTSMITMENIDVLVNYMRQEQFLTDDGQVRSILLSEQGYTSSSGQALQAAAFAYAYYRAASYSEIDGFLLNRETDAGEEVAQGLAFGLTDAGGGRKQIYNVFKYIDTPEHENYTNFAKEIIGISSWR